MSIGFNHILNGSAAEVAPRLLGCVLVHQVEGQQLVGRIVETEAYDQLDAASHSYKGQTPRTEVMFGPSGFAYVYFTYGMHYCMNVVTGETGYGSAVLIRAVEPLKGIEKMRANRRDITNNHQLTNGPAKLCQAFNFDKKWNGHDLREPPLQLIIKTPLPRESIVHTTRIGISRDKHRSWRFYLKDNPYVSRII